MKKTTVFLFIILMTLLAVLACAPAAEEAVPTPTAAPACAHQWSEADCETASVCSLCGEVQAEALGHDWTEATCEHAEQCNRCEKTRGEPLEHSYGKWLLDAESMYRVCASCEGSESAEIDYTRYLAQYVYGRWNFCSDFVNGRAFAAHVPPDDELDPEYIFYEDGRIVLCGFQEKELCTSWSIDRGEYDSSSGKHRIYITSEETTELGKSHFSCIGGDVFYEISLNSKGDTATLSNSFGDTVESILAGTWSTMTAEGLYSITFTENRSFTADFDGEISGFWQPRQPVHSSALYMLLHYEKNGKPHSQYAQLSGINMDMPSTNASRFGVLDTYVNGVYTSFGFDSAEALTDATEKANTLHLGTWTSVDYHVGTPNPETHKTDIEEGVSADYSITFMEDGTFTAHLHREVEGRWELKEIQRSGDMIRYEYWLTAPGLAEDSTFRCSDDIESGPDAYAHLSYNDDSYATYGLRLMNEEQIAARKELIAAAPHMIEGEWRSNDGQNQTAVFREDGTFTIRTDDANELNGNWYFRTMTGYNDLFTYFFDLETMIELIPGLGPAPIREDHAITLSVYNGDFSIALNSSFVSGTMTKAENSGEG